VKATGTQLHLAAGVEAHAVVHRAHGACHRAVCVHAGAALAGRTGHAQRRGREARRRAREISFRQRDVGADLAGAPAQARRLHVGGDVARRARAGVAAGPVAEAAEAHACTATHDDRHLVTIAAHVQRGLRGEAVEGRAIELHVEVGAGTQAVVATLRQRIDAHVGIGGVRAYPGAAVAELGMYAPAQFQPITGQAQSERRAALEPEAGGNLLCEQEHGRVQEQFTGEQHVAVELNDDGIRIFGGGPPGLALHARTHTHLGIAHATRPCALPVEARGALDLQPACERECGIAVGEFG
jgi:hypothetical protein